MTLMLPETTSMQAVGQVASHNTNTNSNWIAHLDWVNAVELDVWPLHNWIVSHNFDVGAGHLAGYMKDLAEWRKAHPNHGLLTVFIEIKSKEGWQVSHFESILLKYFSRSDLFRPHDLATWAIGRHATGSSLRDLVKQCGWPTFGEVKNKIMFVMNNAGDHVVDTYLAERPVFSAGALPNDGPTSPVCFVMSSQGDTRTGYENIVLFNGEYNEFPVAQPVDNCLRRAYTVKQGNDDMVNRNPSVATRLMNDKRINYLCYDHVDNAFAIVLS